MAFEVIAINGGVLIRTDPTTPVEISAIAPTGDFTITCGVEKTLVLGTPVWDDERFPASGVRVDSASTRYNFDPFNGGLDFHADARYTNEPASATALMPHTWIEESVIKVHIHWLQTTSDVPNWLVAYKKLENGEATAVETDYTNHTLLTGTPVFTYVSGTITQITDFGEITMTGMHIADLMHIVLFRDSANTSTLFAGADPSSADEIVLELDMHYQKDTQGSRQEFIK